MDKSVELFYKPPKDEYFEELKSLCIRFWKLFPNHNTLDENQYQLEVEYANEKISRIKSLENKGSNFISMVQMIHENYRIVLSKLLSLETRNEISMRLYGWEKESEFDPFNIWNTENNK